MVVKRDDDADFFADSHYVFESAWFGAYAFQLKDADLGHRVIHDMTEMLKIRREPKATARRTLNIIWAHDEWPAPELMEELFYLVTLCNGRLVVANAALEIPEEWEESSMVIMLSLIVVPLMSSQLRKVDGDESAEAEVDESRRP